MKSWVEMMAEAYKDKYLNNYYNENLSEEEQDDRAKRASCDGCRQNEKCMFWAFEAGARALLEEIEKMAVYEFAMRDGFAVKQVILDDIKSLFDAKEDKEGGSED